MGIPTCSFQIVLSNGNFAAHCWYRGRIEDWGFTLLRHPISEIHFGGGRQFLGEFKDYYSKVRLQTQTQSGHGSSWLVCAINRVQYFYRNCLCHYLEVTNYNFMVLKYEHFEKSWHSNKVSSNIIEGRKNWLNWSNQWWCTVYRSCWKKISHASGSSEPNPKQSCPRRATSGRKKERTGMGSREASGHDKQTSNKL